MLPVEIRITDEDIKYAERILFNREGVFSYLSSDTEVTCRQKTERQNFIKNLDTVDLQAVPGSGKTTALLAKLLILERYMPFDDGSGVMVISHTNAAVDEIKNKIEKYCPKLFAYPNFVGTIQGFVDQFLAIPFYTSKYGKKPYRIDNEIYDEKSQFLYNSLGYTTKSYLDRTRGDCKDAYIFFNTIRINNDEDLISNGINGGVLLKNKRSPSPSYLDIKSKKEELMRDLGCLCFDDAYMLAQSYLQEFPEIKKVLQKRFQMIFVDEMQDMDKHQHDLLENIFYDNGNSDTKYQRVGDINQAIHHSVSSDDSWSVRENSMSLTGSHRLTPELAQAVKFFGLNYIEIEGLRDSCELKPHILVFENPKDVLPKFADIIQSYGLSNEKNPFYAISWTSHKPEEDGAGKIKLQDYYEKFEKKEQSPGVDYRCLRDYLKFYDKKINSLASIRKNILNIFVRVLRLANELDENDRNYNISKFISHLKERFPEKYMEIKLKIFEWSFAIKRGKDVFGEISVYIIPFLKDVFVGVNFNTVDINNFINIPRSVTEIASQNDSLETVNNIYKKEGSDIEIRIGSVHSAKGSTHTATLYMESFYQRGESYESKRLQPQMAGEKVKESEKFRAATSFAKKLIEQSAKMAYVGFSRPTHLLCFAIHKDRFNAIDVNIEDNWIIVRI